MVNLNTRYIKECFQLIHLPTTSCILALAVIGSVFSPNINVNTLQWILIHLFLLGGITANFFDEIQGRPWHTQIPDTDLWMIGLTTFFLAVLIGIYLMMTVFWLFWIFLFLWTFITISYNLELFQGFFHNTASIAISGGLIVLGSYLLQNQRLTPMILVVSVISGCIVGQGRDLYEKAKLFSKDKILSSKASHSAWTLLKALIGFIDAIALILLVWRLVK